MLSKLEGPQLAVDSGNALFRDASVADEAAKKRAAFILSSMGELGVKVMAAGLRDLSAGSDFLAAEAKRAGVQVLSANVMKDGKPVFAPSTVVKIAGRRVGLIGLTAPMNFKDGTVATPTVPAVTAALKGLGAVDVTIVLAAVSYADAMQLDVDLKGKLDFIVQSTEGRGSVPAQHLEHAYLFSGGTKGQQVGLATITADGKGAFTDANEVTLAEEQLKFLDTQLEQLDQRAKLVKDAAAKKDFATTTASMRQRRQEQQATVAALKKKVSGRSFQQKWVILGKDVLDDEAMKKKVLVIEPSYAGQH